MKKTIRSKVYDTETAEIISHKYVGEFGEPHGFCEKLYKTPEGFMFMYTDGGAESPYTEEKIKPISAANAEKWIMANASKA